MRRLCLIGALIIAAGMSILLAFSRDNSPSLRCSLDGSRMTPIYEVVIIQKDQAPIKFSCVLSAQIWLKENDTPIASIRVTDEATGEKIEAGKAFYVESEVISIPHIRNRIHVFSRETDARLHASQFNGKLIKNPLTACRKRPVKLVTYRPDLPNSTDFILPSAQKALYLAANTVLIRARVYVLIYQDCLGRLPKGYSSPPDKPPKHVL
jgi:hypothetical protein